MSSDTKKEIPPFIFRQEFEAFANHYNENMDKALETTDNLANITDRIISITDMLKDRVLSFSNRIVILVIWNLVLSGLILYVIWRVLL